MPGHYYHIVTISCLRPSCDVARISLIAWCADIERPCMAVKFVCPSCQAPTQVVARAHGSWAELQQEAIARVVEARTPAADGG